MIIDTVHLCYDPSHHPFASDGAIKIEDLDSERAASKIIRAVIRYSGIDAASWESYSLHRCYCRSKGKGNQEVDDPMDGSSTLEELGIKGGDCLFIRQVEIEFESETQGSLIPDSSRKRKRDYQKADSSSSASAAASRSNLRGTADQVSNLENLTSQAAATAKSISKLLGGQAWKTQPIGSLGLIQTRSVKGLRALQRTIKMSLQIPQISDSEPGCFNSDLKVALTRAYHQRVSSLSLKSGKSDLFNLDISDYELANELLKGKIKQDGSWERSDTSQLDESAFSKPASRFPLSDSGLSGLPLKTARAICILWNNDNWINQTLLPGLAPISLRNSSQGILLRQIAQLTRVKPGESTPDGFPPIVLKASKEVIAHRKLASGLAKDGSVYGWNQSKSLPLILEILKKKVGSSELTGASSASLSNQPIDGTRNVRRKLRGGS